MSQIMSKSGVGAGVVVFFQDGTTGTTNSSGLLTVPDDSVGSLINAGWEYAASDPGPQSEATSQAVSAAASGGLADSVSRSAAGSAGLGDSVSRSAAGSAGLGDSLSRSAAGSAGLADSVTRSLAVS